MRSKAINRCVEFFVLAAFVATTATACTFREAPPPNTTGMGGTTAIGTGTGGTVIVPPGLDGSVERRAAGDGATSGPCSGLSCQQTSCTMGDCKEMACPGGADTTVSGTIYDPAGKVPLYNVQVYVPNGKLDDFTDGASCQPCDTSLSGNPIAQTITDDHGNFMLSDVPVGSDIPLVIQVGKWRRQISIPTVTRCTNTALMDKDQTRLPSKSSEGHMPKMALVTGNADTMECLLRKIGIDQSEFTPETGAGRVNFYFSHDTSTNMGRMTTPEGTSRYSDAWGGAPFTQANPWWDSLDNLKQYDLLLLSCNGVPASMDKSPAAVQAIHDYLNMGGRVFASHWHNYFFEHGTAPFPMVATFDHLDDFGNTITATIDTNFAKGQAFANWLVNTGAQTPLGQITINSPKHTVDAVNPPGTQRWIHYDYMTTGQRPQARHSVQYMSFNTPLPNDPAGNNADGMHYCGRAVFSDLHVGNPCMPSMMNTCAGQDRSNTPYPDGCVTTELSDQEKALEFMLFDLSSCIQSDHTAPQAPPTGPVH